MQSLRIETVETFVVAMPLVAVFSSGGKSKNVTKGVVVKITASDGSYGISSVDPSTRAVFPDRAEDIAATVREKITPAVLGTSPTNINRLSDTMDSLQDIQIGARAAVEMAEIFSEIRAPLRWPKFWLQFASPLRWPHSKYTA